LVGRGVSWYQSREGSATVCVLWKYVHVPKKGCTLLRAFPILSCACLARCSAPQDGWLDPGWMDPGWLDPRQLDPRQLDPGWTDPGWLDPR
jgi:hypothetical protein